MLTPECENTQLFLKPFNQGQGSRVKGQGSRVKGQGSMVKGQGSMVKGK
ncbi:MAG: hypothetical protein ACFKPT_12990 [Gloeotrichia echinulata GP01]